MRYFVCCFVYPNVVMLNLSAEWAVHFPAAGVLWLAVTITRKPLYTQLETGHLVSAQMAGRGVTVQRACSTGRRGRRGVDLKHKRYVFDPVHGRSCVCDPCCAGNL